MPRAKKPAWSAQAVRTAPDGPQAALADPTLERLDHVLALALARLEAVLADSVNPASVRDATAVLKALGSFRRDRARDASPDPNASTSGGSFEDLTDAQVRLPRQVRAELARALLASPDDGPAQLPAPQLDEQA